MARRYYTWRYNIHYELLKYRTLAAAFLNPPPTDIKLKDLMYLCNFFTTQKFKANNERNNKEKLRSAHLAGTKAYSKFRYDKEKLKEHKAKTDLEGINLTDEQLSVLTFDWKPGYVSGLGYGPKTTSSVKEKRTCADLEKEAYEAMKGAEAAERSAFEARLETAALAKKLKSEEVQQGDFSTKIREEMHSQFALFRKTVSA